MNITSKIIFFLLYVITSFFFAYHIIQFLIARLIKTIGSNQNLRDFKFLILIPAFKEGETLLFTIDSCKKLNYPKEKFKIILLADQCDETVLKKINDIAVLRVNIEYHSKVESLKSALHLISDFDFVVILDADNLVHQEFLNEIRKCISSDTKVIQGKRIPKRINTIKEKLDALTDFIYNELDRRIPSSLRITSTLSGSGFATATDLFRELIPEINTKGGFDKILQSKLVLKNIFIKYCPKAIVFDEKISSSKSYIRQRRRWLYYHFYNTYKYGWKLLVSGFTNLNLNQLHLGIISTRPPLNFLYVIASILILLAYLYDALLFILLLSIVFIFSLIVLKTLKENKILDLKLIILMPFIFIDQLKAIIRITEAKKNSLPTEHKTQVTIDEILSNKKSDN